MNIQTNLPIGLAQDTLLLMGKGPWVYIYICALCPVLRYWTCNSIESYHKPMRGIIIIISKTGKLKQKDQEAFWSHGQSVAAVGSHPKSVLLRSPHPVLATILFSLPQLALPITCCISWKSAFLFISQPASSGQVWCVRIFVCMFLHLTLCCR